MTRLRLVVLAVAAGFTAVAVAQEDDGPDLSFLEYLGSWEDGDEEWVLAAELESEIDELSESLKQDDQARDAEDAGEADEAEKTDED